MSTFLFKIACWSARTAALLACSVVQKALNSACSLISSKTSIPPSNAGITWVPNLPSKAIAVAALLVSDSMATNPSATLLNNSSGDNWSMSSSGISNSAKASAAIFEPCVAANICFCNVIIPFSNPCIVVPDKVNTCCNWSNASTDMLVLRDILSNASPVAIKLFTALKVNAATAAPTAATPTFNLLKLDPVLSLNDFSWPSACFVLAFNKTPNSLMFAILSLV